MKHLIVCGKRKFKLDLTGLDPTQRQQAVLLKAMDIILKGTVKPASVHEAFARDFPEYTRALAPDIGETK